MASDYLQLSENVHVVDEKRRYCLSHALEIGRSRADNADTLLVAAVLIGPINWPWTFPPVAHLDPSVEVNWVSRGTLFRDTPQRQHSLLQCRGTVRKLHAIWHETADRLWCSKVQCVVSP